MKIKNGFVLKELKGANDEINGVIIPVGEVASTLNGYISLNESGVFFFKTLQSGCDFNGLVSAVLKEYSVDEEKAKEDAIAFIKVLKNNGVIDD